MLEKYKAVSYELLRPAQIREIRNKVPIAYIVCGAIEWHGHHNPLGCDSLKAHAVCCEAALRFGGVVLPPIYQGVMVYDEEPDRNWGPDGWEGFTLGYNDIHTLEAIVAAHAKALVAAEWKVIVGVTGHDVELQRAAMERAINSAVEGCDARGFSVMEGTFHPQPTDDIPMLMDHGAAWETSCMQYAYPDTVALAELTGRNLSENDSLDFYNGPYGIGRLNPLKYGSAEMGKRIIEQMGFLIGSKAADLLSGWS